jgi:hypothetical protein
MDVLTYLTGNKDFLFLSKAVPIKKAHLNTYLAALANKPASITIRFLM